MSLLLWCKDDKLIFVSLICTLGDPHVSHPLRPEARLFPCAFAFHYKKTEIKIWWLSNPIWTTRLLSWPNKTSPPHHVFPFHHLMSLIQLLRTRRSLQEACHRLPSQDFVSNSDSLSLRGPDVPYCTWWTKTVLIGASSGDPLFSSCWNADRKPIVVGPCFDCLSPNRFWGWKERGTEKCSERRGQQSARQKKKGARCWEYHHRTKYTFRYRRRESGAGLLVM